MALDLDQVVKIPITAWVVVDGTELEITSLDIEFTASSASARVTFAVGYPLVSGAEAKTQITDEQANAIILDSLVEIHVQAESNVELPGLPTGDTIVFVGYVVDSGPWRVAGSGDDFGWGIEVLHKGIANLSTGSTSVWPFTTSLNFDFRRPVKVLDGSWMSGMLSQNRESVQKSIADGGLWSVVQKFFIRVAEGGGPDKDQTPLAGFLAKGACAIDGAGTNAIAIEALNDIQLAKGTKLTMPPGDLTAFVGFLDELLSNDLRTMNFLNQIQAVGDRCFFRIIPKADGSMLVVPFKTFEQTALKELSSEELFEFRPGSTGDPRIMGVVLYGDLVTRRPMDGQNNIYGCYTFAADSKGITVSPRGIMETVQAPSWIGATAYDLSTESTSNFKGTVETSAPDANTADSKVKPVDVTNARLGNYGNRLAREWARQYRFRGSSAVFSSYLRTDIGLQSTIRVQAPGTIGSETALFGKVDKVRILIDTESMEARTDYSIAYSRTQYIQENIGSYVHPLFNDDGNYAGSSL